MVTRKKRKQQERAQAEAKVAAPKPAAIGTGLADLLEQAGLDKLKKPEPKPVTLPAPGPRPLRPVTDPPPPLPRLRGPHSTAELSALNQAYRDVAPIKRKQAVRKPSEIKRQAAPAAPDPADDAARARLAALVGGGVRFDVRWDDGYVQALRDGSPASALSRAGGASFEPEAQIDLHGHRRAEAQRTLSEFVRKAHRRGARRLLVIVGKGEHSEGGVGVLGEAAVEALTAGVAAPLVIAIASAAARHGGRGALAVMLR